MHQNESIVASGIYYYDNSNVEDSRLAFRAAISEGDLEGGDMYNEQKSAVAVVYGIYE